MAWLVAVGPGEGPEARVGGLWELHSWRLEWCEATGTPARDEMRCAWRDGAQV